MAEKKNAPKAAPMTYTITRQPNISELMRQAAERGDDAVQVPESDAQSVKVNPEKKGK